MKRYGSPIIYNDVCNFVIDSGNEINEEDLEITSIIFKYESINLKCNDFRLKLLDNTYDQIQLINNKYIILYNDWMISISGMGRVYSIPSPGNDDEQLYSDLMFTQIQSEEEFFQYSLIYDFGPISFEFLKAMQNLLKVSTDFVKNDIDYNTRKIKRMKGKNIVGR